MADVRLPLSATVAELVEGIERAQRGCRSNVADSARLATAIVVQLGRVKAMADALALPIEYLSPRADFFEGGYLGHGWPVATVVSLSSYGCWIRRATPSTSATPGLVTLSLRPPREVTRG